MTSTSAVRRRAEHRLEAKKDYADYAVYEPGVEGSAA